MADCATCPKGRAKVRRPYKSVPRYMKYDTPSQYYYSGKYTTPVRNSTKNCDSCYTNSDPSCDAYPYFESMCSPRYPCPPSCPCPSPCLENQCYYCPVGSDFGFLSSIRNGFQRIFNGNGSRKRGCGPCKEKPYRYSISQLMAMDQCLCKLEDDTACIEESIKEALDCSYRVNCNDLKCSLNSIMERIEALKCELGSAYDCYDACRDKYEYDLICSLMDRSNCLESLVYDLYLQLDCLGSYPGACEPDCRKPCCVRRPPCKPNCKKPCCYKPFACGPVNCKPCRPWARSPCDINCQKPCCVRTPCARPPCAINCQKPCCVRSPFTRTPCTINCQKPCCARSPCDINCQKPCCYRPKRSPCDPCGRPRRWLNGNKLCRTSSVIPLGVMLVKL